MCVAITLDPNVELTEKEVVAMHDANKDGFGIAWAKGNQIYWYKTVTFNAEAWTEIVSRWSDYPRLVHFRLSTAGGVRPELCHPFEVSPTSRCAASLVTSDAVLIHNGHWSQWEKVKDDVDKQKLLPDPGPWSDSRLAAFLAYYDKDWLDALGGKVAIMNPKGEIRRNTGWIEYRKGMHVSNTHWNYKTHYGNSYNPPTQNYYARDGYWDKDTNKWVPYIEDSCAVIKHSTPVSEESKTLLTRKTFENTIEERNKAKAERKRVSKAERKRHRRMGFRKNEDLSNIEPLFPKVQSFLVNSKPWINPTNGKIYKIIGGEMVEVGDATDDATVEEILRELGGED